jgi:hypothetical protein
MKPVLLFLLCCTLVFAQDETAIPDEAAEPEQLIHRVWDLMQEDGEELNLYLNYGEKIDIELGGSAGTGGHWFYGFTNEWLVSILDQ